MQPNFKTITALKETRQGRMAVFFDDTFDFSVDEETLLRHKLKVGQKFTPAQYEQLKSETQYQKAREKAFSLLSYKSFTRKQLASVWQGIFLKTVWRMCSTVWRSWD